MHQVLICCAVAAGSDADPQQSAVPAEQPEALPAASTRRELLEPAAALAHLRALLRLLHLLLRHEAGLHQHPPLQGGPHQVPPAVLCMRAPGHRHPSNKGKRMCGSHTDNNNHSNCVLSFEVRAMQVLSLQSS